ALQKALSEIVNRHEVLRSRIIEIDAEPFQEIASPFTFVLPVIDLSHLLEEQAEVEVQRLSIDDARQLYTLGDAPLMRAKLLRLGEQEYVLILNFHHIVCDGSSLIIFYQELATLYEAFLDGKVPALPSLPVQYADYAVWQHKLVQAEVLESQLAYWKRQLGTGLTALDLPTDYDRPVVQTYRGARLTKALSEELTKGLKELSRREGVTLFMTLLAAFKVLLYRYTCQEDIVVGSPVANRSHTEIEGLIGFFVNTLVLRTDLSGNPSFKDLLTRGRNTCLGAYAHQDLPFEKLVQELNPNRDLGRNPLFQVMLVFQNTLASDLSFPGCTSQSVEIDAGTSKVDLTLSLIRQEKQFAGVFEYNSDLFDRPTIERMGGHFQVLLEGIVTDPAQSIST